MAPIELPNEERLAYHDLYLTIDFSRRAVLLESRPVELTSKEYAVLAFLAGRAGEILPREALLAAVWGYNDQVRTRTLDVHLARVRKSSARWGTGTSKPSAGRDAVFSRKRLAPAAWHKAAKGRPKR